MKVIKNCINKSNFLDLKNLVVSDNFNWFFLEDSAFGSKFKDSINYSFYHNVMLDYQVNSNFYSFINSIALQAKDKFNLDNYKIFRIRFGLTTSYGKEIINKPHIDTEKKHKVILLYITNSDGNTYFYKNNKVINSVTPEENKAILFDGSIYHSSSKPIKYSKRIILNINLENGNNKF